MKITFKDLITSILQTCDSHKQVEQSGYGLIYKKIKSEQLKYIFCFLVDGKSTIVGSKIEFTFSLLVMDKLIHDDSNSLSSLSNCFQVGIDILGELQYKTEDWYVDYTKIIFQPFTDSYLDDCIGWKFDFMIKVNEDWNSCIAPFN